MSSKPIITLTTDFGADDPFAGVLKGVILNINPDARIVDLTHGIQPQDIAQAALILGMNFLYFPEGSIHLVVVDPGVGSLRRPILVSARNHFFVAPDNGVLTGIYSKEKHPIVVHIKSHKYVLNFESPTFQGRDVFAPVAAWLSLGVPLLDFGSEIADYETLELPQAGVEGGRIEGCVIFFDRFGNAITNITGELIAGRFPPAALRRAKIFIKEKEVPVATHYEGGRSEALCAVVNSSGLLELFLRNGNASSRFGIKKGDRVRIIPG